VVVNHGDVEKGLEDVEGEDVEGWRCEGVVWEVEGARIRYMEGS